MYGCRIWRRDWSISIQKRLLIAAGLDLGRCWSWICRRIRLYEDAALLELFDAGATYTKLVSDTTLSPIASPTISGVGELWLLLNAALGIREKT